MHEFPLIEVRGSPREMGRQHGARVGDLIQAYLRWIEKLTGQPRSELARRSLSFVPAVRQLSTAFLEEVEGLAQGARLSFGEAMLCQARGEAARAPLAEGCTAFALSRSATRAGVPLAGQNQDLPPEFAEVGIVLRVEPGDGRPRAVMFTFAGQLGYMGMNEYGVAHFANAVGACPWCLAVPHYPLKRVLLEQRTVTQCLRLLERQAVCSAANMVFCDGRGEIADAEIRTEGVVVYADEHPDRRLHTNHYLSAAYAPHQPQPAADSVARLQRLRALVSDRWGTLDVVALKAILADHAGDPGGICRHGQGGSHSICGYIAEPARRLFHVRRGHGCLGTWRAYDV